MLERKKYWEKKNLILLMFGISFCDDIDQKIEKVLYVF